MAKASSTPAASFRPLHDKILIKRDTAESKTAAGIYLPEKAKDTPKTGVIEAVGTGTINHDTGELIPLTVKKGQRVLFSSYSGTELKLEGQDLLVMTEDEILAVIEG